jgi:hypothetical protein
MNTEPDIVERLRNHVNHRNGPSLLTGARQMMLDAADEIIKLRAERDAAVRVMRERCAAKAGQFLVISELPTAKEIAVNNTVCKVVSAISALPPTSRTP